MARTARRAQHEPRSFWVRNGLTLAFAALMLISLVGHMLTGWRVSNEGQREHGEPGDPLSTYVAGPHFLSTLFENWESEFLQMALFVLLTAKLRQKGASESRPFDPKEEAEGERPPPPGTVAPWPVRRGGLWARAYGHSLSAALFALFAVSFALHLVNSWKEYNQEELQHGEPTVQLTQYAMGSRFWFESFQNWQSEFLSVVALVLLSIWLREKDSTESKPVEAPHSQTGA